MIASADVAKAVARVGRRWEGLRDARLFISGGTGFVGRWLLATLCDANRLLSLNVRAVVLTRDADAFARSAPDLADDEVVERHRVVLERRWRECDIAVGEARQG